jgi:phosphopantothenoylcysteine decarboxylase/phosphopantothenate--cysteine ligase
MIGNLVGRTGSGFASPRNSVFALDRHGDSAVWESMPKPDLAWRILDWLLRL